MLMRYNILRDTKGKLLRKICLDVRIEPDLLPVGNEDVYGNKADNARLDIFAIVV